MIFSSMCKRLLVVIITALLFSSFIFSSYDESGELGEYYADIEIEVSDTGLVNIDGITNYEGFKDIQTHQYTSKEAEMWLLNISVDEEFSKYLFRVILPKHSSINYIKTTPNIRFETVDSRLNVVGVGEQNTFNLLIQYSHSSNEQESAFQNYFTNTQLIILIVLIVLLLLIMSFYFIRMRNNSIKNNTLNINTKEDGSQNLNPHSHINEQIDYGSTKNQFSHLPLRQQKIISILCSEKRITQRLLEKKLNIPKSSVSRNIQSLVNKHIIVKKESGNTNVLELNLERLNLEPK
ncbi:MAG: helix-turn-helix transcriptional regulator [Candidatus Nanoarchaeia archaeon]